MSAMNSSASCGASAQSRANIPSVMAGAGDTIRFGFRAMTTILQASSVNRDAPR
ncbi:MAG: hypothetical protein WCG09_06510 [Halobacteriota archaeon]